MPDPIDEGREALNGAAPTKDLWADATTRAADAAGVPLAPISPAHRRGTWLAVAAAIALIAGTVSVLSLNDDDTSVDTVPASGAGPCAVDLPVDLEKGPSPALLSIADPDRGTTVHGKWTDGEDFEVTVPAATAITAIDEASTVQLERGAALLTYVAADAGGFDAQVRYDPKDAPTCTSFSVAVAEDDTWGQFGGLTNEARAAIDIANQLSITTAIPVESATSTSIFESEGCSFGVSGEPIVFTDGPADPPLFALAGQPEGQTIAHAAVGSQVAEIHVPGLVLDDLVGEQVEEIELSRGTAHLWFGTDFVQVRWFTGSQEPCDSFTVTVAGGTEDGNRHAAVDLADRLLLPDEIDVNEPPVNVDVASRLEGSDWSLYRSTLDGNPTDSVDRLRFTFLDGEANWTDGCNSFSAPYTATGAATFRMGDVVSTKLPCPTNAVSQAIQAVMGADEIEADVGVGLGTAYLGLIAGDDELLLGDPLLEETAGVPPGSDGFVWPIILANDDVYDGPFDLSTGQSTALAYAASALGWRDARIKEGEPSEDGRNGDVFSVTSAELGGWVSVWVDGAPGPVERVVYRVDVPGRELVAATDISISGTTARIVPGPGPAGTVATTVKLVFDGEVIGEGAPGEVIVLTKTPAVPGAVSAYFYNTAGRALSAWARPLPAGDFIGN